MVAARLVKSIEDVTLNQVTNFLIIIRRGCLNVINHIFTPFSLDKDFGAFDFVRCLD
jgi:hypothetical protein